VCRVEQDESGIGDETTHEWVRLLRDFLVAKTTPWVSRSMTREELYERETIADQVVREYAERAVEDYRLGRSDIADALVELVEMGLVEYTVRNGEVIWRLVRPCDETIH
jgi:hypothetical protein